MTVRIAITGAGGMLAQDLVRVLTRADTEVCPYDHNSCDITDAGVTTARIREVRPEVVIHLAAFTKVNECERHPELAFQVNAEGTRHVAEAANAAGARLVYVSTDYVFDGRKKEPYTEEDPTGPLNAYGRSKLEGERFAAGVPGALIVRSGWLFGLNGRNFVEAILDQAGRGSPLRVVGDQVGCPAWTAPLARAIVSLVDMGAAGTVHAPGGGQCSWNQFACAILEQAGLHAPVEEVSSPPPGDAGSAPRPAYSVLDDSRLRRWGVEPLPHWKDALRDYLVERSKRSHAHRH